jgi:hypothetical protein
MALYRAKWPLGTEARLMFDILHYTFLRLGDAHRFGPPHLRQIVRHGGADHHRENPGQHHRHGAGSSRVCIKPAGGASGGKSCHGATNKLSRAKTKKSILPPGAKAGEQREKRPRGRRLPCQVESKGDGTCLRGAGDRYNRADPADRRSQSRTSGHVRATNSFPRLGLTKLGFHLSAKSTI